MACLHASSKVVYSAPKVGVLIGVDWELPQILSLAGCTPAWEYRRDTFPLVFVYEILSLTFNSRVVAWEMAVSHFPDAFPGAIQNIPL